MSNYTIREFLKKYDNGDFNSDDVSVQIDAGWYDWFCKDTSLKNKTVKLVKKLKRIVNSSKINQDTMYVFFKNNCPMVGNLYDDFRICDVKTGDVIFTIVPSSGHTSEKGKASLWGFNDKGSFEELVSGTWKDVVKFFEV